MTAKPFPLAAPMQGALVANETNVTSAVQAAKEEGLERLSVMIMGEGEPLPAGQWTDPVGPEVYEQLVSAARGNPEGIRVQALFSFGNGDVRSLFYRVYAPAEQVASGGETAAVVTAALEFARDMRLAARDAFKAQQEALSILADGYRQAVKLEQRRAEVAEQTAAEAEKRYREAAEDASHRDAANEVIGNAVAAVLPKVIERLEVSNGVEIRGRRGAGSGRNGAHGNRAAGGGGAD